MFSMEEVLSKRNQRLAFEHLERKKDGVGIDGMSIQEFVEYWGMNWERIESELLEGAYMPGIVKNYEIINGRGKKRTISNMTTMDKFITRLLAQKLKRYFEPTFLENSYAYQDNKGILQAVMKAKEYAAEGNLIVVEVDIKNYFDTVPIERVLMLLRDRITDEKVITLLRRYLYCKVDNDEQIIEKDRGLIQGNSISPILSNLYLHSFDTYMQNSGYHWVRFADNIYVFATDDTAAMNIYSCLCDKIKREYMLEINEKKSGVHDIFSRHMLGYMFYKTKGAIEVQKYQYKKTASYGNWHRCVVQKINREYHIVRDGILNKKDYALLFENEEERHHIPVEIVDNINLYNEVSISTGVLRILENSIGSPGGCGSCNESQKSQSEFGLCRYF